MTDIQILYTILVILIVFILIVLVAYYRAIRKLQNENSNQNVVICKLMYHRAKEIEDYEILAQLKERMPEWFDPYKF